VSERVALVVTGRLEFRGLARALRRLFTGAEFFVTQSLSEVDLKDSTSARVDPARNARNAAEGKIPAIDDLVEHLAGNLCGRGAASFSVLVEDLELANRGNEANVVQAVRESVVRHLAKVAGRRDGPRDLGDRLRERASFHLFDPMVEAYFYHDPAALDVAQGGLGRAAHRVAGRDPERFEVDAPAEPGYFGAVGECPRHRRPQDRKCPWAGALRHEHPKKYLKYLCREPSPNEFCSTYLETEGGANALAGLDWTRILAASGSSPFLRALVEDLEDALKRPPAIHGWPAVQTSTAPTARCQAPRARILRNL
jgi:hypothetical protein